MAVMSLVLCPPLNPTVPRHGVQRLLVGTHQMCQCLVSACALRRVLQGLGLTWDPLLERFGLSSVGFLACCFYSMLYLNSNYSLKPHLLHGRGVELGGL